MCAIKIRTRFRNARILTMTSMEAFDGEVQVEGNRITYVGKEIESEQKYFHHTFDCNKNLLMPGFVNAHTHSGMTFLRSLADDLQLDQWLNEKVFPIEKKLTEDDIYWFSRLAIREYLTSGITSNFDMYLNPYPIIKASQDLEYRTVLCGAVNDFTLSVENVEDCFKKYNEKDSLISFKLGFSHEYTTSEEKLKQMVNLSHKYQSGVYTHLQETKKEVDDCIKRTGKTPLKYLCDLGMFDYGGGGFHCVHVNEQDLELLEKYHLNVVTNPSSNCKLASGVAPISDFLKRNINVAIGTDGSASNNCLDMFREMFLVSALAKIKDHDASSVDAYEVLKMATVNGAKMLGLDCGTLEEGKLADLILIDLHQPNMLPINNIAKNIVYSGTKENVLMTMVNGNILYMAGNYLEEDEEKEIQQRVERLKKESGMVQ